MSYHEPNFVLTQMIRQMSFIFVHDVFEIEKKFISLILRNQNIQDDDDDDEL